jgi:hypothetical protein
MSRASYNTPAIEAPPLSIGPAASRAQSTMLMARLTWAWIVSFVGVVSFVMASSLLQVVGVGWDSGVAFNDFHW